MAAYSIPFGRDTELIMGLRDPHIKNQERVGETPESGKQKIQEQIFRPKTEV